MTMATRKKLSKRLSLQLQGLRQQVENLYLEGREGESRYLLHRCARVLRLRNRVRRLTTVTPTLA